MSQVAELKSGNGATNALAGVRTELPAKPAANVEVEQALLGALLNDQRQFDRITGEVASEDFCASLHAELFDRLRSLHEQGRTLELKIILSELAEIAGENVGDLSVAQYVARLYSEATTTWGARDYARQVRTLADRRRLAALGADLVTWSSSGAPPSEVASAAIDKLDAIATASARSKTPRVSLGDAADSAAQRMRYGMEHPNELPGMTWGLRDLDEKTGGLHRGELVVIAARPSMGKTALGITCARLTAQAGHHGFYSSLEMGAEALGARALADTAFDHRLPIEFSRIARGSLTPDEAVRVDEARRTLRLPLLIDPAPSVSVPQILARARQYQQKLERDGQQLDILWVDHLHLIDPSDRYKSNRTAEVTEISGGLKALAKTLDISVVALAQLSRRPEDREDKRPILSDLRDSGSIEQDADTIIFLYRPSYYLERETRDDTYADGARLAKLAQVSNDLEAIIAKQRNGPIGNVRLFYDVGCNAIRDAARR